MAFQTTVCFLFREVSSYYCNWALQWKVSFVGLGKFVANVMFSNLQSSKSVNKRVGVWVRWGQHNSVQCQS